jgi:hypothetical protein
MVNAMNHAIMRAAIGIAEIVINLKSPNTALKDALTDGLEMVNAMNHAIMRAAIGIVKIVLEFSIKELIINVLFQLLTCSNSVDAPHLYTIINIFKIRVYFKG